MVRFKKSFIKSKHVIKIYRSIRSQGLRGERYPHSISFLGGGEAPTFLLSSSPLSRSRTHTRAHTCIHMHTQAHTCIPTHAHGTVRTTQEEEGEEDLFVFNDIIEGPRARRGRGGTHIPSSFF
jgi:hypothetical protein